MPERLSALWGSGACFPNVQPLTGAPAAQHMTFQSCCDCRGSRISYSDGLQVSMASNTAFTSVQHHCIIRQQMHDQFLVQQLQAKLAVRTLQNQLSTVQDS